MLLTAGLLTYNDGKYAKRCLETLIAQTGLGELGKDWQIVVLDNASQDRVFLARIENEFPNVILEKEEKNHGFGKGHNLIMQSHPADFHAVLNIDALFNPDFLNKLIEALKDHPHFGSATGKLLQWNFGGHPEKTNIVDSTGIEMTRAHAFKDRDQGKTDTAFTPNEHDAPGVVFGGSGAATMYRRSALEEVAMNGQYFDERMFMYKEDVDLAYRLVSKGHFCLYVPSAIAWHDRTAGSLTGRSKRSAKERARSAAHETIILRKHKKQWSRLTKFLTSVRQFGKWSYLLLFEPRVFFSARKIIKNFPLNT
jgi:GT2 family glycosyltransferase